MTIFATNRRLALIILVPCCLLLGCQNDAAPAVPDGAPFFEQAEQDRRIGDANKAVTNYTEAIRLFQAANNSQRLAEAYVGRGLAYDRLQRKQEAAADYQEANRLGYNAPHP